VAIKRAGHPRGRCPVRLRRAMDSISWRSLVESYRTIRYDVRYAGEIIFSATPRAPARARGEIALIFVDFRIPRAPDEKTPPSGLGWIRPYSPLFARRGASVFSPARGKPGVVLRRDVELAQNFKEAAHASGEERLRSRRDHRLSLRFPRLISLPAVLRGEAGRA